MNKLDHVVMSATREGEHFIFIYRDDAEGRKRMAMSLWDTAIDDRMPFSKTDAVVFRRKVENAKR